jgi:hypothetical protein
LLNVYKQIANEMGFQQQQEQEQICNRDNFPSLQSAAVGAGSKTNGVSNGQPQTAGSANSVGSAKQQQTQQQDPKPVECNLCHRKFKNIPALNGHMRLHGGYFKKVRTSSSIHK